MIREGARRTSSCGPGGALLLFNGDDPRRDAKGREELHLAGRVGLFFCLTAVIREGTRRGAKNFILRAGWVFSFV